MMLRFFPNPQLKPYVQRISYFESSFAIPQNDLRTIVPNGGVRLVIPCRSRLSSLIEGNRNDYPEMTWWVVGQMSKPIVIEPGPNMATIGIELSAWGAYRLLPVKMNELTDISVPAADIWGPSVRELQEQLAYAATPERKIAHLEAYLVRQLACSSRSDALVDFMLQRIQANHGQVRIEELCSEAGYTKQYMGRRFAELVGLSPKKFADILRFNRLYRAFMLSGLQPSSLLDELFESYYDQAHFNKAFRKYTGLSPREFRKHGNLLGSYFLT